MRDWKAIVGVIEERLSLERDANVDVKNE